MWKTERDHCSLSLSTVVYYSKVFTFCLAIFVSGKVCGVTKKGHVFDERTSQNQFCSTSSQIAAKATPMTFPFCDFIGDEGFFSFQSPIYTTCKPCHFHEVLPSKVNKRRGGIQSALKWYLFPHSKQGLYTKRDKPSICHEYKKPFAPLF